MSLLQEMFPLLIPIFVLDVILAVAAVRHILWHPHYRFGNRAMWLVLLSLIHISVYLQGGLTYESGKLGILLAADALLRK